MQIVSNSRQLLQPVSSMGPAVQPLSSMAAATFDGLERKLTFKYRRYLVRRRKVRRTMSRVTAPEPPEVFVKLGFNTAVAYRAYDGMPEFTGSSLTRKKYAPKEVQVPEERTPSLGKVVDGKMVWAPLHAPDQNKWSLDKSRLADKEQGEKRVHVLAERSRGKIRDKFTAFFSASRGRNTFCTLTFIQRVRDADAVKILNKFFVAVRKEFPEMNYIWVAERQKKNTKFPDNIHFHMIFDRRLPVREYNALWVLQQYNSGLVGWSKKLNREISMQEINQAYEEGKIHRHFNPLDIKPVKTMDVLAIYLTKYVTKNEDSFGCLAWHCSRKVSRMVTGRAASHGTMGEVADKKINSFIDRKTGELRYPKLTVIRSCKGKILKDSKEGEAVCIIGYINNRKYFHDFLKVLDNINSWILYGNFIPDIPRLSIAEYHKKYKNAVGFY
jgi:hypothetical protein